MTPAAGSRGARRDPLRVGFLVSASAGEAEGALGLSSGQLEDRAIVTALLDRLNRAGGAAGRRLVPVFVDHDAQGADYEVGLAAACQTFVEDERVPVVMSTIAYSSPSFEACLTRAGVSFVNAGQVVGDDVQLGANPGQLAPAGLAVGRRLRALVDTAAATGQLTRRSRLGVVVDDCPASLRGERDGLLPALRTVGLAVVERVEIDCPTGYAAAAPAASSLQNAVLRFRSSGVDRVLLISSFEFVGLPLMQNQAEAQQWRPTWLVTSVAYPSLLVGSSPEAQLERTVGAGWAPAGDVGLRVQPAATPAVRRCTDLARAGGITWSTSYDYSLVLGACDELFLLEALLARTAGSTGSELLVRAARDLGTGFVSPSSLGGATDFSRRRDAPSRIAPFAWDAACACFRYTGPPRPVR